MPDKDHTIKPSPLFKRPLAWLDTVCEQLETAELAVAISLPQDVSVFDRLDSAVHAQLRRIGAVLGSPPPEFVKV